MSSHNRIPPEGYRVREATDREIFVDLDTSEQVKQYETRLAAVLAYLPMFRVEYLTSKSGNVHIILQLTEPMGLERRLMFAALLGSDPWHVLYAATDGRLIFFRPNEE